MKKNITVLLAMLLLVIFTGFASAQIFTDDFETGTPAAGWEQYWPNEEMIQAVGMGFAPAPLATGGDYVGYIHDVDGSYNGAAILLNGSTTDQEYSIEADVYCYVNHAEGSAYTGLAVYSDSTVGTYIKMAADFDANQRIRFYNNHLDMVTFQYTFYHEFSASDIPGGIPTEDGWHKMKIEARTLVITQDSSISEYYCYFDDQLLTGCPIIDDGPHRMAAGQFGLFAFQMYTDGIPGFFDNIVVEALPVGIEEEPANLAKTSYLAQNYPNPFNPITNITYEITKNEYVELSIFDVMGKKVKTLVSETQTPSNYTVSWDATDSHGRKVPSGIYFYTLKTRSFTQTNKMVLMK